MLNRPSSRRKSHSEGIELNLVPILDTMVTLIGFLLFTTSFLVLVQIESVLPGSPPPDPNQPNQPKQPPEKPLQLTAMIREGEIEINSPFKKIEAKHFPNTAEGQADTKNIHEHLIEIKKMFPNEKAIVLMPVASIGYESLIKIMDSFRSLDPTDPPIFLKNETSGVDEAVKFLFPNIVFGNL